MVVGEEWDGNSDMKDSGEACCLTIAPSSALLPLDLYHPCHKCAEFHDNEAGDSKLYGCGKSGWFSLAFSSLKRRSSGTMVDFIAPFMRMSFSHPSCWILRC